MERNFTLTLSSLAAHQKKLKSRNTQVTSLHEISVTLSQINLSFTKILSLYYFQSLCRKQCGVCSIFYGGNGFWRRATRTVRAALRGRLALGAGARKTAGKRHENARNLQHLEPPRSTEVRVVEKKVGGKLPAQKLANSEYR